MLSPPTTEPAVVLDDTASRPYHLIRAARGKVVLVYFGYTHCPDICPTMMADVAQALRESSAAVRADVDVVFISVDPVRDTPRVIRHWLDHFNPAFVGLRGSIGRVIAIQKAMGVPVSKVAPHSKHGYTVAHSAELLAFTPDHEAHVVYTDGPTTISDLRHDLATLTTDKAYGA
ncbi:MAG TPA: SCO family protein [Mycobacteriales bacterium]|nr:SCO family protein [Mycobacteriales bacterium]